MASKRKGRERRRYNKRRRERRAMQPTFGRYTVERIKDKIIEVKTEGVIYTGKVIETSTGIWSPNYKYSSLTLRMPKEDKSFYFVVAPYFDEENGLFGKEFIRDYRGNKRFPYVKIERVLPIEEAILFKIEHDI